MDHEASKDGEMKFKDVMRLKDEETLKVILALLPEQTRRETVDESNRNLSTKKSSDKTLDR